ncbi:MAG: prolyl oligopeptidase family serine peptidase [Methylotenera sp.]|nr:prolyl oligopeptidase family serine peptidase [Methylotenera sp.]
MRTLLPGLSLTLAVLLSPCAHAADAGPPAAPVEVVTDDYYGTPVADPYRWMESGKDERWMPWLKAQADHTEGVLSRLPGREGLLKSIQALSGEQTAYRMVRRVGQTVFIQRRDAGAEDARLYVRTGRAAERLLLDPAAVDGKPQSLDWWHVSPNGRLVAVGLSQRGTEASVLRVLEVATGRWRDTRIPATDFGQVSWLPDSSGFAYLRFVGEQGTPSYYLNNEMRLHRLGSAGPDRLLLPRDKPPVPLQPHEFAAIRFDAQSPTALLVIFDGRRESQVYVTGRDALLAGRARWTRVAGFEAQIEGAGLRGDELWLLSTRDAPKGRLLLTSARRPDLATARAIELPGQPVVESFTMTASGPLVQTIEGSQMGLWRVRATGEPQRVALPFPGSVMVMSTVPGRDEAYLSLAGWLQAPAVHELDARGTVHSAGMSSQPAGYDASRYEARTAIATAADGTRIPYTVLSLKGRAAQGPGPLLLEAYGAYGYAVMPTFQTALMPLLDRGARYVMAHVRGGGEFGRDWHYGGRGPTKANTWLDAIAVAEALVRGGETTPAQMNLMGTSAGGVMVGQAVNTRPDLFAGAVANVGFMNPLRYVSEQNNADIPEWGGPITDAATFKTMFDLDPYQHIKPGTAYPATLVVSGLADPRAATFHSAKYAARLAAATSSGQPVLLRIDFGAGHGMGSTRTQRDAMWADIYSFVLWRAGVAGFQPPR